jgi:hypothetical protein
MEPERHPTTVGIRWATRATLVVAVVALLLAPQAVGRPAVAKLFLGISGDPARFQSQTGQASAVRSFFLGWQQGQTWGSPFPTMLERMGPVPMFHIGTRGRNKQDAITPQGIAGGAGDAYLVALNQGASAFGRLVYGRLMAEMNHCARNYAAFTCGGTSRGPAFSPAAHANAFARFAAILRGGTRAQISAKLTRRGLPPYTGPDLPVNPPTLLRLIWNPLGGARPTMASNNWARYYPGDAAVDVVGNDMYGSSAGWSGPQNEALYAFARRHGKPYGLPEWGLEADDAPTFVQYVCDFVKGKAAIELAAYYEAKAGSRWDLQPRPMSRDRYRRCLTPLGKASP